MSKKKREASLSSLNISESKDVQAVKSSELPKPAGATVVDSLTWKKRLLYPVLGLVFTALLGLGVMASNGWLPHTDALSGKRTGWFGRDLQANNLNSSGSANLLAFDPTPSPTPQLSKEYLYAGSRMLAVEDAGASASPPADLAVWRPGDGVWYVLGGQGSQQTFFQWGSLSSQDSPIPGDYDGDGKTDFAVYRASNYNWIINYSGGSSAGFQFGASGDIPAPADFDGDGKTDAAVYRPSSGTWYYYRTSDGGFVSLQFGVSTDVPVPKDYDGDGKADVAVWRASSQTFYVLRSSDNSIQGGQAGAAGQTSSTDIPVPADYDGDGKADYAARHGGDWQINQTSNGQLQTVSWQQAGDKAVQNDYDGDGKVDIAVWRESTGMWYIRQSSKIGQSNELRQVQWGQTGDVPVPAFYRR